MNTTYEYMDEASIDPELICSICQLPFIDPCCTPCGETFCYECISHWIQTQTDSCPLCPLCRRPLSINVLTRPIRMVRNMLDRLRVKCIACGQTQLQRDTLEDHIQKVCPKTVVSCPSADIKCSWRGQRDQLNQHIVDCRFESMRHVITQFVAENQQLNDQITQQATQITGQQNEIKQLRQQTTQQRTQIGGQRNEVKQLREQMNQQKTQIGGQQNENQQLQQQVVQLRTQVNTCQHENQQLQQQVAQLETQVNTCQHENQQLQQQVAQLGSQVNTCRHENQQLQQQVVQLETQVDTCRHENQQLLEQLRQKDPRITSMRSQLRE